VRARLELAKVLYWECQYERADQWFRKAEALGADPADVHFHWGNNAYQEGDLPSAIEKLRTAKELDPAAKRTDPALERAESRKKLLLDLDYDGWHDKDNRSYLQYGANIGGYVSDRLRLDLFADRNRWARKGLGDEKGTRVGAGALWHFADEYRLTGKIWQMSLDHISDHFGGLVNVHIPNALLAGNIELEAAREEIDTVEAVRKKILSSRFELNSYSRIKDEWDLNIVPSYTHRSDNNDTYMLEASFGKRLHEWPFLSAGYTLRLADSDRNPPEYWAPKGLQEHQLYVLTRGEYKHLHYYCALRGGLAEEFNTDWRFVWGTRLILDYTVLSRLTLTGEINYLDLPTYNRTAWRLGIKYIF
jgi:tetratricopeptide (TPR) repeat protein